MQESGNDQVLGKFVVPNAPDEKELWYFAMVLSLEGEMYKLFLCPPRMPAVIERPRAEVEGFTTFYEEDRARECMMARICKRGK